MGGRPHDGRYRRSLRLAQQDAAKTALDALPPTDAEAQMDRPAKAVASEEPEVSSGGSPEASAALPPPAKKRVRPVVALVPRSVKVVRAR